MAALKLTKNELRAQQNRLNLLLKYLPTLQLKKALLESEVSEAEMEMMARADAFHRLITSAEAFSAVLSDRLSFDIFSTVKVKEIRKRYENIAGVEVPYLEEVVFEPFVYALFDTPVWVDGAIKGLRQMISAKVLRDVAREKKEALEKELREVSIRVNLFEKILIPRSKENIKKIKVFLGDQLLAAVSRAKVAKRKIQAAKGI